MQTIAKEPDAGVELALLPAVVSVGPSSVFTVGLKIHHRPGFHTYWMNPGAVGYPTRISWDLPDGFKAGPLRWPVPEISSMAGHPVFGYESDVMLLADITSPAEVSGDRLEFRANASWMACAHECRPGNQPLSFTLPVAKVSVPDPANEKLFSEAELRIPKPLEDWSASLESKADSETILLILHPPTNGKNIDVGILRVFSSDGQISSDPAPLIKKSGSGNYRIEAKRAEFSPKTARSLPFVLVGEKELDSNGRRFGTLDPTYPSAK